MKIAGFISIAVFAAALSGCATASHDTVMDSWIGHTAAELTSRWGEPVSAVRTREGMTILTWQEELDTCRQEFVVDRSGEVVQWQHDGCSES